MRIAPAVLTALFSACSFGSALAEKPVPYPSPSPAALMPGKDAMETGKKFLELSQKVSAQPEIKELKTKLDQAQKDYVAAIEAAIAKEDPEIVTKFKAMQEAAKTQGREMQGDKRDAPSLMPAERERLVKAQREAYFSPEVRKAREKREAAKTDQEKATAETAYRDALRKATLAIDKDLQPILDKIETKRMPSPSPSTAK